MKKRIKNAAKNEIPNSIIEVIIKNRYFLICSHINPEGDAIGSQLALRELLLSQGKKVRILNSDRVPLNYHFISGWANIERHVKDFPCEVIFILDCSDFLRIGKIKDKINKDKIIINIDHHISNTNFGNINWIDEKASCVCEMIYRLYKYFPISINKNAALAIYTGLVSDTGSFHYTNTTSKTLAIASELLRFRLPVYDIYRNIFGGITFSDINLLASILQTARFDKIRGVCWLRLERRLLKETNKESDIGDLVLSLLRLIKGVRAVVLFKESLDRDDEVRVNFRSDGRQDVSKIAKFFGGGGHKTASGCTIKGKIEDVENKVLSRFIKT